jgi:hypothetical protein
MAWNPNDPTQNKPPEYAGIPDEAWQQLWQYNQNAQNPNAQYTQGVDQYNQAYGSQGGYDAMQALMPAFGALLLGGGNAANAYGVAANRAVDTAGMAGLTALQAANGGAGMLGSTKAGVQGSTLINDYAQQKANIEANKAQMTEQNFMNRFNAGGNFMSGMGNAAAQQRGQSMQGGQGLAGLGLQQNAQSQNQLLSGLNQMLGMNQDKQNFDMEMWQTRMGVPRETKPKGLDVLSSLIGPVASIFMPMLGLGGGGGGSSKPPSYGSTKW